MTTRRILIFFMCPVVCLTLAAAVWAEEAKILRVGVIGPFTGPFSSSGTAFRDAVELAYEDSGSPEDVKFLFEDDELQPKLAISALRKLLTSDRVGALMVWGTPNSLAINSIAEREQIPMVAHSLASAVVDGKRYVMKHWLTGRTVNEHTVQEVRKRGLRNLAIVALANDAMLDLKDRFLKSNTANIVYSVDLARDDTDLKTPAVRISKLNPDGVYVLLWSNQLAGFTSALRALGYKGQLFGSQGMEDVSVVKAARGGLEGAWFIGLDDRAASEFYRRYRLRFQREPVAGAANAYDVAMMIISGRRERDLNRFLHTLENFHGALGVYSATESNDFQLGGVLKCVRGEQIVSIFPATSARSASGVTATCLSSSGSCSASNGRQDVSSQDPGMRGACQHPRAS